MSVAAAENPEMNAPATVVPMVTLQALLDQPAALPVVPKVVQQLIASFQQEDVSVTAIAAQLEADPVLSAKTLRLANSAYFHVSRRVETLDDALRLLGFVMVRNLVLAAGIGQAFKHVKGFDLPRFWRLSVHTAGGARWLADLAELNGDLAFVTGLLQGLGHLVMRSADPRLLQRLDRQCPPLEAGRTACEVALLGFHHGEVAAELARRWKFPTAITEALAAVADAPRRGEPPLVGLVRLALWKARRDESGADDALPPVPEGWHLSWTGEPPQLAVAAPGEAPQAMPPVAELAAGLEALFDGD